MTGHFVFGDRCCLKKMKGHSNRVLGLAVSQDGQLRASRDRYGKLIAWREETGESLTQPIKAYYN
jgi:hypothetical protein